MNEWAGTWLFGGLPNVPYQAYRKGHLEHHRTAGTEHDPDLAFVQGYPATRASLARKFLRDVSGINGVKNLIYQVQTFDRRATAPFLVAHGLLFGTLWALGVPQVYACWWIGMVFFFPLFVRLRVMSEHGTVPNHVSRDPRENTGTTLAEPCELPRRASSGRKRALVPAAGHASLAGRPRLLRWHPLRRPIVLCRRAQVHGGAAGRCRAQVEDARTRHSRQHALKQRSR
jgi:hypothetical protein